MAEDTKLEDALSEQTKARFKAAMQGNGSQELTAEELDQVNGGVGSIIKVSIDFDQLVASLKTYGINVTVAQVQMALMTLALTGYDVTHGGQLDIGDLARRLAYIFNM